MQHFVRYSDQVANGVLGGANMPRTESLVLFVIKQT